MTEVIKAMTETSEMASVSAGAGWKWWSMLGVSPPPGETAHQAVSQQGEMTQHGALSCHCLEAPETAGKQASEEHQRLVVEEWLCLWELHCHVSSK